MRTLVAMVRHLFTSPRSLGYFTLLVVALIALLCSLRLYHLTQQGQEFVWVSFQGSGELIGSLQEDDPVRIRGVEVGQVDGIIPAPNGARVHLRFWKRQRLYADARAINLSLSMMGERVVVLDPGDDSAHVLPPGAELKGTFQPGIAEVMSQIYLVLRTVENLRAWSEVQAKGNANQAPLHAEILHMVSKTQALVEAFDRMNASLERSLPPLNQFQGTLRKTRRDLPQLGRDLDSLLTATDTQLSALESSMGKLAPLTRSSAELAHVARDTTSKLAVILWHDSLFHQVQQARQLLNRTSDMLEGQMDMRFNIHLLGSNPSQKGE